MLYSYDFDELISLSTEWLYGIAAVVALASFRSIRRYLYRSRGRSMSFNSLCLMQGSFPPECEVPSPIINAALLFKKCPSLPAIKLAAENGFSYFERFRSIPKYNSITGEWTFEPCDFSDSLYSKVFVGDEASLVEEINRTAGEDLSGYGTTPAWHIRIIENQGSGLSAVVLRIHHVIGDGVSLVAAIGKVFYDSEGNPANIDLPVNAAKKSGKSTPSFMTSIFTVLASAIRVLGLAVSAYDSNTLFTSPKKSSLKMTKNRRTIFFPTLKLEFVKNLKNKAMVTVNDVLLSATSGAIRKYCESRGDPLMAANCRPINRALIPVAFPRLEKELNDPVRSMRNKWAFVRY